MCEAMGRFWKTKEPYFPDYDDDVAFSCFSANALKMLRCGWYFEITTNHYNRKSLLRVLHKEKGLVGACEYVKGQTLHELAYLVHTKSERIAIDKFLRDMPIEPLQVTPETVGDVMAQCAEVLRAGLKPKKRKAADIIELRAII